MRTGKDVTIRAPEAIKSILLNHMEIYKLARKENTSPAHILENRLHTAINKTKWEEDGFTLLDIYAFFVLTQGAGSEIANNQIVRDVESAENHFSVNHGQSVANELQDLHLTLDEVMGKFGDVKVLADVSPVAGASLAAVAACGVDKLMDSVIGFGKKKMLSPLEKKKDNARADLVQALNDASNQLKGKEDELGEKIMDNLKTYKKCQGKYNKASVATDVVIMGGKSIMLSAIVASLATAAPAISTLLPTVGTAVKFGALAGIPGVNGAVVGAAAAVALYFTVSFAFHLIAKKSPTFRSWMSRAAKAVRKVKNWMLKKNFLKKIFGYEARCEFWEKIGLRFWILVGYVYFLMKFGAKLDFRV